MHTAPISAAALLVWGGLLFAPAVVAAAPPDDAAHFEKKVRPVLVEKCVSCHGPEKQKGGLRVDSRAALLQGGDSGPSLVPGKPNESLLTRVLAHDGELKMPPKNKLPAPEIAALKEWVQAGAPWPDSPSAPAAPAKGGERVITAEEKAFWAFQPVERPAAPPVRNPKAEVRNDIDRFLLARLEREGLSFAPPADRRTLLRRITFDLTGLPPTASEIAAFLADGAPDAYEKVVDRLLASPAYGEKWGRRWLDVARYADSNGMDENLAYVNAWRYRDYVIRSVNADKPYDQFVKEQIAGDLMPGGSEAERADRLTATGFLVIGPKMLAEDDPMKMRMDILDEQLDTLGQAFMGLTLGCARCHDHKFDPITAADYYALGGMFYSTKTMKNHTVVAAWNERSLASPEATALLTEHERAVAAARAQLAGAQKGGFTAVGGFAGPALVRQLRAKVAAVEKAKPAVPEAMAVEDAKGENLRVHLRGNHTTLGAEAPRRFPRVLGGDTPLDLGAARSGRLELAEWLARPEHPLTARVMVNRIWAGHFGAGLVRSTDNFGRLGDRPTHPELLDWLASEFTGAKWSVKHMHRLIVTSTAYRMSTRPDPAVAVKDPDNKLLSHFSRRRLDAEEVRDGMLAAAGLLDRTAGGSLLKANPRQYINSTAPGAYNGYAQPRRSVYLPVIRSGVYDVLQTLDFPDPSVPSGQRVATTIPTQALFMLNGALADQTAEALAKAALAVSGDDAARVCEAYQRVYGRAPTTAEVEKVQAYLQKSLDAADAKLAPDARTLRAWRGLCRVLLASNEFVFVE
ncbi:PSD1 and planctomycete cytochrome C domain-containing protein [Gemmata sp. JC673]|uniref:PSD1 and planctomycete cytochrome C domain-containing protein n=1 Tax=Gemmata algarum TaxID=2975278 RepID=A0ABU5F136_9BACT|nr:PSD1 and planctomycete cytochrome C domain-containing protein [Gemmata algarum]MDY3561121.1 PSD1 and planctomycete cytochrome C domain-containing protein [Gemmata algarum]